MWYLTLTPEKFIYLLFYANIGKRVYLIFRVSVKEGFVQRENSRMPGYYDGRYWTLWKLPMFGCNDPSQVLNEIQECKKAHPNAYIRCLAFDNTKQCQCMAFIIQKPATTAAPPQQNIF